MVQVVKLHDLCSHSDRASTVIMEGVREGI